VIEKLVYILSGKEIILVMAAVILSYWGWRRTRGGGGERGRK
jgi:hypothetical protein